MLKTGIAGLDDQLPGISAPKYQRHQPEQTLLYQIVKKHYPEFLTELAVEGKSLPHHVHQEFIDFLKCGLLEHGFLRVRCESCHHEKLVAFSCKRRGFCPSCGARRMVDSAALLADEVLPNKPIRQWVLTVSFPLRFLFAAYPEIMSKVLGIVTRTLSTHLAHQAGFKKKDAHTGAVTLIQRFGSALNLNVHFHMLFLDGVYVSDGVGGFAFHYNKAPTVEQLTELLHIISQRVASFLERRGLLERDEGNSIIFQAKGHIDLDGDSFYSTYTRLGPYPEHPCDMQGRINAAGAWMRRSGPHAVYGWRVRAGRLRLLWLSSHPGPDRRAASRTARPHQSARGLAVSRIDCNNG
jgi:ribosomal protein S27E